MLKKVAALGSQELVLKGIRARRRFKALVRNVIANLQWLSIVEDDGLSVNVRKNVQLIKKRRTAKSLLTVQEKGILCKPIEYRTKEEIEFLYQIIGGWKCFRRYPENLQRQLVAVTYFIYFPAGRIIVKQNQVAHAMYYVISGEATVSITSLDPVTREEVTSVVGKMIAGSMFGEASLLHGIPRTATVTTTTPCEFLLVKEADFNIVLKESVAEQWKEIQNAMSRFSYFEDWDDIEIRECCVYSKIKTYHRGQTILGDDVGVASSCYFILRGQCRVIEHLLVDASIDEQGRKHYNLCEGRSKEKPAVDEEERIVLDERKGSVQSIYGLRKLSLFGRLERAPSGFEPRKIRQSLFRPTNLLPTKKYQSLRKSYCDKPAIKSAKVETPALSAKCDRFSKLRPGYALKGLNLKVSARPSILSTENAEKDIDLEDDSSDESSVNLNVETHFMQVCILSETACFGLGENMKHRRIVAMTDNVECLLIPRYWLLQRNKGNMWSRVQQYLDLHVPSTRQVFEEFMSQRNWLNHRRNMVTELFGKPPVNAYYNIPYSIRINEDIDPDKNYYCK